MGNKITNRPSAAIVAEIETLQADFNKVIAAAEIIGKPATVKAQELQQAIAAANIALATALADEAEKARKERLASHGGIAISVEYPSGYEGNVLRAVFTIEYSKGVYDMGLRRVVQQPHKVVGFAALPDDTFAYLVENCPEAIPAEIADLAPGDPMEAFRRYFIGQKKGYLRAPAAPAKVAA